VRSGNYLKVPSFSPEVLAEAIERKTITTEQLMSLYHCKGLSTISYFITLTAVLTADVFLNLADNGEFQRQRVQIQ